MSYILHYAGPSQHQKVNVLQGLFWRLEETKDLQSCPHVLVQSSVTPDWSKIGVRDWFDTMPNTPVDLELQLALKSLQLGKSFRFRIRANPCVSREGKRLGLFKSNDQAKWFAQKGLLHGFKPSGIPSFAMEETECLDLMISQEQMLRGKQRSGHDICVYSVQYDGILTVTDIEKFLPLYEVLDTEKQWGLVFFLWCL